MPIDLIGHKNGGVSATAPRNLVVARVTRWGFGRRHRVPLGVGTAAPENLLFRLCGATKSPHTGKGFFGGTASLQTSDTTTIGVVQRREIRDNPLAHDRLYYDPRCLGRVAISAYS